MGLLRFDTSHLRRRLAALACAALVAAPTLVVPSAAGAQDTASPSGSDLIAQQYLDFLSREPDAGGLAYWRDRLDAGVPASVLIQSMVEQPEFEQVVAPLVRLYLAYFGRTPDAEGLNFWAGRVRAGQGVASISQNFTQSTEFSTTYGPLDDAAFVDLVYRNVLGRQADPAGSEYWRSLLAGGVPRGSVMTAFSESVENRTRTFGIVRSTMLYLGMLRRSPDPAGLTYWASQIDRRVPYGDIIAGFLESTEYRMRLTALLPQRQPLTGEATRASAVVTALAVKIDNVPRARPQQGLNQADIVVEEKVEGDLTRLIAIFHSDVPAVVGPVRSIRTTDFDMLAPLNRPMLAASGANQVILNLLQGAPVQNVNALVGGGAYRRDTKRPAPHNLFVTTSQLYAIAPAPFSTPPALFTYRGLGVAPTNPATPSAGVDIAFGRTTVNYRWNAARAGWTRTQDGTTHVDTGGAPVTPENVVVMTCEYRTSIADAESPEAVTVGSGPVEVFTGGVRISGTWSRGSAAERIVLRDANGVEIRLTPGETWIALAPAGTVTVR